MVIIKYIFYLGIAIGYHLQHLRNPVPESDSRHAGLSFSTTAILLHHAAGDAPK